MKILKIIFFSILLIGLIQIMDSCKKESLKSGFDSTPMLYVRGNFNNDTLNFTAGENLIVASPFNIEVDTFRFFNIQFERKDNWGIPSFEIRFNNHTSPYTNISEDLENTIKTGNYLYTEQGAPSSNPYQFLRVTITYYDSMGNVYTSRNPYHDIGNFTIYKTEKYISNDNKAFLKAYINFDCILVNATTKVIYEFKNGNAVIAFEYL